MKKQKYLSGQKVRRHANSKKRLYIILAAAVAVLVFGGLMLYALRPDKTEAPRDVYSGPTEQEKQETEQHKDDLVDQNPPPVQPPENKPGTPPEPAPTPSPGTPGPDGRKVVTPTITYAGKVNDSTFSVSGYIEGIKEDGGTCTASLTKDGMTVTGKNSGVWDNTKTACASIDIPRSQLSNGNWNLVLSYESATSKGSATKAITVE